MASSVAPWAKIPIVSALGGRDDRGGCYADALALRLPPLGS